MEISLKQAPVKSVHFNMAPLVFYLQYFIYF